MIELFGLIGSALAIVGVILNNRGRRICFAVWLISNSISMAIHIQLAIATAAETWSLAGRDAIFIVLAISGWRHWKRKGIGIEKELEKMTKEIGNIGRQASKIKEPKR
jgi:nicotinamide riboside transporter PnuC